MPYTSRVNVNIDNICVYLSNCQIVDRPHEVDVLPEQGIEGKISANLESWYEMGRAWIAP